jgi:hypothetical protein
MQPSENTERQLSNFERLAAINVNDQVEKKGGLSYLSWAWAIDRLLRADPEAEWHYGDNLSLPDGTMLVFCTVRAFGKSRTMQLPVMDYKNRAIANPDAFAINTAMQRALVKAIALHGLGLYIYAGEDLPPGDTKDEAANEDSARDTKRPNTATQVLQDEFDAQPEEIKQELHNMAVAIIDLCDNKEPMVAYVDAHIAIDDQSRRMSLWKLLPSYVRTAYKKEQAELAQKAARPKAPKLVPAFASQG